MLFLAAVPSFVLALRGIVDPEEIDLDIPIVELVALLLASLGPAAIATYLLWRDGRLSAAGFDRRPAGFVAGYGALGAVCCFLGLYLVSVLVVVVYLAAGGEPSELGSDETTVDLTVRTVASALAIAVTAGVSEEVVYRAYAVSRMEEAGYSTRAALVAPWAVFTVVHLYQGPIALLVIGVVGAVLTWLYRWKRSVWPVMVAHALYDIGILLLTATASSS